MASRRSRSHQSSSSTRTTDEEQILLNRLASKLQQLLPIAAADHHPHSRRVSATNVLEETCRYIRSLNREVDDLSERLSELLPGGTGADAAAQAEFIRSLFHGD